VRRKTWKGALRAGGLPSVPLEEMKLGGPGTPSLSFGRAAFAALSMLVGCPQLLHDRFDAAGEVTRDSGVGQEPTTRDAAAGGSRHGGHGADAQVVTRPFVASAVPDDGARGVLPDAALMLRFSTTMNTGSVEDAYGSEDIPPESVTFVWSESDTVLQMQPTATLRTVSGSDPDALPAVAYTFEISDAAKDTEGRALEPKRISFSIARLITQSSSAVQDRALTGNWCSDQIYGTSDCEQSDRTICFGDSSRTGEPTYRGFVTFDLRSVPRDLIRISGATLSMVVELLYGSPFVELGTLRAEHLPFATIGDESYAAPPLSTQTMTTAAAVGDTMSADVSDAVRADWGTRDSSQFRLAFDIATDTDADADVVVCQASSARLELGYWLP
jgi:hypothetical protein